MAIYSAAVLMKLPWPAAYLWYINGIADRLGAHINSDIYKPETFISLAGAARKALEHLGRSAPDMPQAKALRGTIAFLTGDTKTWLAMQYEIFAFQEQQVLLASPIHRNVRVLGPVHHIVIGIGSTVHIDTYIKAGILGLRQSSRAILLLEPFLKREIVNPCMLEYWSHHIEFIDDPDKLRALRPLQDKLAFDICGPMRLGEKTIPWGHSAAVLVQHQWLHQQRTPLLKLTPEHVARGRKELRNIGIPEDAWFVTAHVREGNFGRHRFEEPYRDANIKTYFAGFQSVTDVGGWVIRLGDSSMPQISPMRNVFDYAHSAYKSDWMDVFLSAAARFMIGTSSGMSCVSYAFGVPIAMTNYLSTSTLYPDCDSLFLPKLLRHLADGEYVNFRQQMSLPLSIVNSSGMFRNRFGLEVVPNTSEDIRDLIIEMLEKLGGVVCYNHEDTVLQNRFRTITAEMETLPGLPGVAVPSRIGRNFLARHKHLLD